MGRSADEHATSEAQLAAFFEANLERAHRLAWRLLADDAAAEDVVQDAFVRAYRSLGSFRGDAALSTWFYRILVHTARNHRRWLALRNRWTVAFGEVAARVRDERATSDALLRARLARAVGSLGRTQREVFVLVHLEGFTVKESADLLGKAEGTVKTHLHRALAKLREELRDVAPGVETIDERARESERGRANH